MAWTKERPAAKFKGGDAVFYGTGERRSVITIVETGEYHSDYRDRFYLARFSDNTVRPVWESEIALAVAPKEGTDQRERLFGGLNHCGDSTKKSSLKAPRCKRGFNVREKNSMVR